MAQSSITMFTNDSGAAGGAVAYVQDAFSDVSDPPSTNSGWSSTISNNPLNNLYGNDDFPRYGAKTLWIKDLVLESNRALWINGEPTYRIIWNEPFPSAQGYVYGNVSLKRNVNQTFVQVRSVGDGIGVGGVFARCMFLAVGNTASAGSATGSVQIDGVSNSVTLDWSNLASSNPATDPMYHALVAETSNETYQIHDYRLTANQAGSVFTIAGVIVYSENPSLTIDQFPGITYNNKSQGKSSANTTLALPSFACSLGGRSVIWKNAGGGYSMSSIGVSTISSIAQGNSGTNILNVTAGTGASFSANYGVISSWGSSFYVGVVQSISTDALTVYPTLPFGISNSIYRYFQAGQSLAINGSLNILAYTFGSTEVSKPGFTTTYLDPLQNFYVWGSNYGPSFQDGIWNNLTFGGASGFVQCDGYFSAAEIEWFGMSFAVLSGTMTVNGLPAYSHANIGFTGVMKKTVFSEAGPGWNSFAFFPGSSFTNASIQRVNLYTRHRDISASFGVLASFDTIQSYAARTVNATNVAPGTFKRVYADQLMFRNAGGAAWTRLVGATWPGGVAYAGGLSAGLSFQYWGTNFAVLGGSSLGFGGSLNLSWDAQANQGATAINQVLGGQSLGFHSISLTVLGGTAYICGIDFFRPVGEMKNLQTFAQAATLSPYLASPTQVPNIQNFTTAGTFTYNTPSGAKYLRVILAGAGAGGSGAKNDGTVVGGGNGGNSSFGSLLTASGGAAGGSGVGTGGPGGTYTINPGALGLGVNGAYGQGNSGASSTGTAQIIGGMGGATPLGGAGAGGGFAQNGIAASANTGSGGGGATADSAGGNCGAGGGAGAYIDVIIPNPASSYTVVVGAKGTGGNTSLLGGNGADGFCQVWAFF